MNVVAGKDACDYIDAFLAANLFDDVTHPQLNRPTQNLVAIFCCPNDVIAMVENAVDLLHNRLFLCEEVPGGIIL